MPGLLTASELAELLHVSRHWVLDRANDHDEVSRWLGQRGNAPTRASGAARKVLPAPRGAPPPPTPVNLETALAAAVVADALDVPLVTVNGWVAEGLLPGVSAAGRCVVDLDAFEQWQQIIAGRVAALPRGRTRTWAIRDAVESTMLQRRGGGWALTPGSARRRGASTPSWCEVLPSGRR